MSKSRGNTIDLAIDVGQDDLLQPHFDFGAGFIDWQAHIRQCRTTGARAALRTRIRRRRDRTTRHLHDRAPFTPELFDRWLQIFHDTVDGGWSGPNAAVAKKRATGMEWAMAQRLLGKNAWRSPEHR